MVILEIKKLYFNKLYNQWRGYPFIYEELNKGLYIRILGIEYNKDIINNITANFKDLDDIKYTIQGELDFDKRLAIFKIPSSILNNDGLYEVKFSVLYKDNKYKELPIQTFEIFKDRKLNKHLIERHWDLPDYTVRKERYL